MADNAVADVILRISLDDSNIENQIKDGSAAVATGATSMFGSILQANLMSSAISAGLSFVKNFFAELTSGAQDAYRIQLEAELKLETVMRQRMKATDEEIQGVKDLASELQGLGIIGDEVSLSGMQQLATFATQTDTIKTLMPALQNLLAQQKGYNATAGDAVNIGNLMGKVMQGQTAALTRVGITFSEAQEEILKYGTEAEKAATLAEVITDNVGNMNEALASTEYGKQVQLSNTIGDIKEKVGDFITIMKGNFIDTMIEVVGWIDKAVDGAIAFAEAIGAFMEEMGWKKATEDVKEVNNEITETEEILEKVKETAGELAGFDKFNLIGSVEADESELETAINSLEDMNGPEDMNAEGKIEIDTSEAVEEMDRLTEALAGFGESFEGLGDTIFKSNVFTILGDYAELCLETLDTAFYWIGIGILEAGSFIGDIVSSIFEGVDWFFSETVSSISATIGGFMEGGISGAIEASEEWEKGFQEREAQRRADRGHEDYKPGQLYIDTDRWEALMNGERYIETTLTSDRRKILENEAKQQQQSVNYAPNIYIGSEQITDFIVEDINRQTALKGYSVLNIN